tara:strand:+ start:42 stop:1859 length:1818 start_codon:yes stop_codon:yes gene_type:complete
MEFEEFKTKVINKSLTIGDAFDHILAKKLGESKRNEISSVYKGLIGEDIDLNQPYFDTYSKEPFVKALSVDSKSGKHRFKEFGSFETEFTDALRRAGRNEPYERITDYQKKKGIGTVDFGYQATQIRAKEPMRGVIFSRDFDKIFNEALELDLIDQETKDYMIYEKYTGQRVETNIGAKGLKINELAIARDPNGEMIVQVAEKKVGNKTRPSITYKGAFAEFLAYKKEQALDRAKLLGKKPSEVNVFNTTVGKMDKAWNTYIRPKLEAQFSDSLPLDKATGEGKATPKVLRKILARQLVQEFKYPRDLVKSWMGHAGAGINAAGDILEESYVGAITDERTAEISNSLAKSEGRNLQKANVNQLFLDRNPNVVALKSGKAHQTFTAPFTYETRNTITKPDRQLTEGEIRLISASAEQQAVKKEIKTEEYKTDLERRKQERLTIAQQTKELTKSPLEEKPKPKTMTEWSESITEEDIENAKKSGINLNKLTKYLVGATTVIGKGVKSAPIVGDVISGTQEAVRSRRKGEPMSTAVSKGMMEALPVSPSMIRDVEGVAKKSAEAMVEKSMESEGQNVGFLEGLTRSFTGTPLGGFSSGGFINKNQSRR